MDCLILIKLVLLYLKIYFIFYIISLGYIYIICLDINKIKFLYWI